MILLTAYQYHSRKVAGTPALEGTAEVTPPPESRRPVDVMPRTLAVQSGVLQREAPAGATKPASGVSRAADKEREIRNRAIGLFNRKDYEGALRLFRQVENPDPDVLLGTGICYFKLGDYRSSVSFLKKVPDRSADNFDALKVMAFAYYRLDDIEESFAAARRGLSVRKDSQLQALYERLVRERKARRGYTEEDSSHFRILYDGYEHGGIDREILDILEDAYRTVGQDLDYFPTGRVTVILYTDSNFYDTTQAPQWSGGLYDGKIRIPVKGLDIQEPAVRKVLFHEYTHVLVHRLAPACPLWMNEGLAEYFSAGYPHKTGQIIPLRDIAGSFAWLRGRNVELAYLESYSAVSSLIDRYGLYRVKAVLQGFGAGKGPDEAFEDALGISYSQFVSGWGKKQ